MGWKDIEIRKYRYVKLAKSSVNLSLKYLGYRPSGCKDIKLKEFDFVANFNSFENVYFL